MKKTILKFGLMAGAFSSVMMVATVPFENKIGFDRAEVLGYTLIILSFLLVFFGIRSYRDNAGKGQITFGKAFAIGTGITLINCVCYMLTWEVLYFTVLHDFMDRYGAYLVGKLRASGASAAAIQTQIEQLKKYKEMYENPFYNAAVTLLEPLPVGLVMTVLSAAILRKKGQVEVAETRVTAAY